ncbi:MAG: hypothetical protein LC115_10795 [Bacteroidia bacterium]|nr:hypothetical protein [Bacteroidia bacterium]
MRFLFYSILFGIFFPRFVAGQPTLKKITFPNDTTKIEYEYYTLDGQKHGLYKWYYDNKQLRAVGFFKHDKTDSLFVSYFRNGHKKSEVMFHEGAMHGSYKTYFPTGKPEIRGQYDHNQKQGKWVYLTDNGQIERTEVYENGKLISPKPKKEPTVSQDSTDNQNNIESK